MAARTSQTKTAASKASAKVTSKTPAKVSSRVKVTRPSALQVLKDDHHSVDLLFKKFEDAGERAHKTRENLVARMIVELAVHAGIEEQVFYPAVREKVPGAEDVVLEGLEEHHIVKWTLSELEKMHSQDERYTAKVTVLIESVRHHVKEEEGEMFPEVRKALTRTELEDLGEALLAAKKAAPTRPHPRAGDEPPANLVAAAVTAPLDAAVNAGQAAVRKVRSMAGA